MRRFGLAIVVLVMATGGAYLVSQYWGEAKKGQNNKGVQRPGVYASPRGALDSGIPQRNGNQANLTAMTMRDLKMHASNGDSSAACVLAKKLSICERISIRDRQLLSRLAELQDVPEIDKAQLERLAAKEQLSVEDMRACAGVSESDTQNSWRYMVQAADAGNVSLMMEFITRPPLDPENTLDNLEGWQTYRDRLPKYLENAVSKGNKAALLMGHGLFSGRDSVMGMSSTDRYKNDYKALVYAEVITQLSPSKAGRLVSEDLNALLKKIDPSLVAKARSEAVEIAQKFDRGDSGWLGSKTSDASDFSICTPAL